MCVLGFGLRPHQRCLGAAERIAVIALVDSQQNFPGREAPARGQRRRQPHHGARNFRYQLGLGAWLDLTLGYDRQAHIARLNLDKTHRGWRPLDRMRHQLRACEVQQQRNQQGRDHHQRRQKTPPCGPRAPRERRNR